jgi:hypothetical protein
MCRERQRLLHAYGDATRQYSQAVERLVQAIGQGLYSDFDVLRRACRKMHETSEHARMELYRHEADHFCDRNDFVPEPRLR